MAKTSKRKKNWVNTFDREKEYVIEEALDILKRNAECKFDETLEIVFHLGIEAQKNDQTVRGSVSLPHGSGKNPRVLAFVESTQEIQAKEAGADYIADDDIINNIQKGWLEFDSVVATPAMMPKVGKISRIIGPRGLMPNPKDGNVTQNIAAVIKNIKRGQVKFRNDKNGILHLGIGKVSFEVDKLKENIMSVIDTVKRLKPHSSKGIYMKKVAISSTMGPSVILETKNL